MRTRLRHGQERAQTRREPSSSRECLRSCGARWIAGSAPSVGATDCVGRVEFQGMPFRLMKGDQCAQSSARPLADPDWHRAYCRHPRRGRSHCPAHSSPGHLQATPQGHGLPGWSPSAGPGQAGTDALFRDARIRRRHGELRPLPSACLVRNGCPARRPKPSSPHQASATRATRAR